MAAANINRETAIMALLGVKGENFLAAYLIIGSVFLVSVLVCAVELYL